MKYMKTGINNENKTTQYRGFSIGKFELVSKGNSDKYFKELYLIKLLL